MVESSPNEYGGTKEVLGSLAPVIHWIQVGIQTNDVSDFFLPFQLPISPAEPGGTAESGPDFTFQQHF